MASESSAIANTSLIRVKSPEPNFHFVEIDCSKSKDLPVGACISSPKFTAGGFDFVLDFYPQGSRLSEESNVALYLRLVSDAKDVIAKYSFEVHAKTKKLVSHPALRDSVAIFPGYMTGWGYHNFLTADKIKEFYCENGILVISINIEVLIEQQDAVNYPNRLSEHIKKRRMDRERYDLTFEVDGDRISARELILASRSPVSELKLFGCMAELAKMEQMAIDKWKDEKLVTSLTVDTLASTLLMADRHGHVELKNKCLDFVCDPEKFSLVALTDGYFHIMQGVPALFAELKEKVRGSSRLVNRIAKKPRTGDQIPLTLYAGMGFKKFTSSSKSALS